jgi:NAD dependent epimerase/dehydratase family enzyme
MRHLRRAVGGLGRFIGLPAPAPRVRLGSRFVLNTDPELALLGRFVISKRLESAGFLFRFPEAGAARRDLFGAPKA